LTADESGVQSPARMLFDEYCAVYDAEPLGDDLRLARTEADIRRAHFAAGTTARCLAGGGVRSASFCLGVVQGLAKRGLFQRFHYLSTVSGGGYLGSMLAAWMYRTPGGAADVERALRTHAAGDDPALDTLRRYVRYLAPRQGFFAVDTWTLVATYVRNFALNALIWFPAIALLLLAPLLAATLVDAMNAAASSTLPLRTAAISGSFLAVLALLAGVFALRNAISDVPAGAHAARDMRDGKRINRRVQAALAFGVLLLSASTYWLAFADPDGFWALLTGFIRGHVPFLPLSPTMPPPVVLGLVFVLPHAYLGFAFRSPLLVQPLHRLAVTVAGALVGFVTGWLIGWIMTAFAHTGAWALSLESYVMLAPPAFLAAVAVGEILFAGATSRFSTDFDREWWARAGGAGSILAIAWVGLCAIAFLGPALLDWLRGHTAGLTLYGAAVALAGVITRILLQREVPLARDGQPRPRLRMAERAIDAGAAVALAAILAGIAWVSLRLVLLTVTLSAAAGLHAPAAELAFAWSDVLFVAFGFAVVLVLAGACVDVNRFSLHGMYRDRLIRTFLGATRAQYPSPPYPPDDTARYAESKQFEPRDPDAFIQFDRNDNPIFRWLAPNRSPAAPAPTKGPFLVVNAALNLVGGRNLAWQERKAASFTFTSLAVGSPVLGYRGSAEYAANDGGITLGTAMAVSGAAVSPNAGSLSSPLRTFVLALCNARLGWWLGHPADIDRVRRSGPAFAVYPLVSELLGRTDERHPWLFVSDGGHFENLGLYEAVRRGCRDIVVVDASADPDRNYDDLGNAIRKIRIDLGVRIERAGPLRIGSRDLQAEGRYCALFDVIHDNGESGSLLYIKSAVYPKADNMPIDVLQYAGRSGTFPHESTARQFFTESQFESYRALGEFEVDAIVEGVEMANRPDPTVPESIAEFIEIAAIRMTE
jgi:hypothetical protein